MSSMAPASTGPAPDGDEDFGLYNFANELQDNTTEPWFLEMTRLRRIHILHLNKKLAFWKKSVQENETVTDDDAVAIGQLLHEQANAIRDFQLIRSLDFLSPEQMELRMTSSCRAFPVTAYSPYPGIEPFRTENYRCLPRHETHETIDSVREFLRRHGPRALTWSKEDKRTREDQYTAGYAPQKLSPAADVFARFVVAMVGALFILVPMYIMSFDQNRTKNLVTTTIAVVLFTMVCSITLRTTNDQTLGSTAAYAAVLVVFVGLTS